MALAGCAFVAGLCLIVALAAARTILRKQQKTYGLNSMDLKGAVFVDGSKYATLAAALSACGSAPVCDVDARGAARETGQTSTISIGSNTRVVNLIWGGTYSGTANPLIHLYPPSSIDLLPGAVIQQTNARANAIICGSRSIVLEDLDGGIMGGGTILGPGASTASVGIIEGGTSDPGNSASNGCNYVEFNSITVSGFGTGEKYGNNAYLISHKAFKSTNGRDIYAPYGLKDSGEQITYYGGVLSVPPGGTFSKACIYDVWLALRLYGTSLDDCGVTLDYLGSLHGFGAHYENPGIATSLPYVTFGANARRADWDQSGGDIDEDSVSPRRSFFEDDSTVANHQVWVRMDRVGLYPAESLPELFYNAGGRCCDDLSVKDLVIPRGISLKSLASGPMSRVAWDNPPDLTNASLSGFGSGPSVTSCNDSDGVNCRVNVGTGGTATSGAIRMPYANDAWFCSVTDTTHPGGNFTYQSGFSAGPPSIVTLTNYNTSGTATAWKANDILAVTCKPF